MKRVLMAVMVLGLWSCASALECDADGHCPEGAQCVQNYCVAVTDAGAGGGGSMGGGTGGGGGDAGMGGGIGGGDGGTGGGGGSMPQAYCADAGLSCADWQECAPTLDGGECVNAGYSVTWVTPDAGLVTKQSSVSGSVRVTKADGGTIALTSLPVSGAAAFSPSNGLYSGTLPMSGADGDKTFVAGWPAAGISSALTIRRDTTAPTFTVRALSPPTYGSDAGFVEADPTAPSAVKKDDTVVWRVESADTDVAPETVRLSLVTLDGGESWDAGAGAACLDAGAPFCRDYTLVIGPQPMNNFVDSVKATATGEDDVTNPGMGAAQDPLVVTRWKWARSITGGVGSADIKGSPAIGPSGDIWVPVNLSQASGGGLYRVTASGNATQPANDGPIEASPAVGINAADAGVVFYMTTSAGMKALGGNACGTGDASNVGSLAVLNDGTTTVRAAGVVGISGSPALRAVDLSGCALIGASGVPGMSYPGNMVTDGAAVWYPTNGGGVAKTDTTMLMTPVTFSIGSLTTYGLGLFGTKLAGGGGGGINQGRVFVVDAATGNNMTGYNPVRHVSGVSVGRRAGQDVLFAVTQETTPSADSGLLRRFDAAGENPSSVVWPSGFTFNFPTTTIPGATTPVLGAGGLVYAVASNGNVAAVSQQDLSVSWTRSMTGLATPGQVVASATLDCNRTKPTSGTGVYYFATTGGWLVAYIVDSPGLDTNAPWPKYQHDARNTGNLSTSKACP